MHKIQYSNEICILPDKELLPEDVIINKYLKSNGQIDLSRFNLVLNDRELFIGLENIESNAKFSLEKGDCIGIGITCIEKQNFTFTRSLVDPKYKWKSTFHGMQRNGNPENLMISLIID